MSSSKDALKETPNKFSFANISQNRVSNQDLYSNNKVKRCLNDLRNSPTKRAQDTLVSLSTVTTHEQLQRDFPSLEAHEIQGILKDEDSQGSGDLELSSGLGQNKMQSRINELTRQKISAMQLQQEKTRAAKFGEFKAMAPKGPRVSKKRGRAAFSCNDENEGMPRAHQQEEFQQ